MGSTAKMKAGLSQAPGAHQEVLFCSAQTSDSCEAEEQHQKDRFSSVRQGCCGWIQGEPRQAVQPHQPHQDSGCRGLRRCEVLPWQKDHVHVPCKDREGQQPFPSCGGKCAVLMAPVALCVPNSQRICLHPHSVHLCVLCFSLAVFNSRYTKC